MDGRGNGFRPLVARYILVTSGDGPPSAGSPSIPHLSVSCPSSISRMIRSMSIRRSEKWMRFAAMLVAVLVFAGCSKPTTSVPNLAGKWRIEFRIGRAPLWMPNGAPYAVATVDLRPDSISERYCRMHRDECRTGVAGSFRLTPEDGFPRAWRDGKAEMIVDSEGAVIFVLGPCCDQGRIGARGAFDGERIRGGWSQELAGEGPGGRFEMRRIR